MSHAPTAPGAIDQCMNTILTLMRKTYVNPKVLERLDPDRPLVEQGMDSVDLPLMVLVAQDHYKIEYDEEELTGLSTLREFAALTARKAGLA